MNILIIGATSGIGKALYTNYIETGNNVAIMGRRKDILEELSLSNPSATIPLPCDISNHKSFDNAFEKAVSSLKNIDIAIVCAGIGELNPSLQFELEEETISTNVVGWTNVMDKLYHLMENQGKGQIVSITSIGGLQPTPVAPSYSASKAYQINYTKSLQAKSKKTPILITEIRPGLVDTKMAKGEGLFWVMPVEKVTKQIISAINKKKKLHIVTKRWRILNWIVKHFM